MTEAAATAPSAPPFADRVKEFFTLQGAERAVKSLPQEARTSAQRELAIAFQKRDAAETLWPRGSCAEALKLARASLDVASAALDAFDTSAPGQAWVAEARALLSAARERAASRSLPEIEGETKPEDEETFRVLIDAGLALQRVVGPHLAAEGELKQLRRSRIVSTVLGSVSLIAFVVWVLHVPDFKSATASGQADGDSTAEKAFDGDTKTDWYAPNGQLGTLDLHMTKTKKVKALHIMAINPPWHDRGIKDGHFKCLLNGAIAKETDYTFPAPLPRNTPQGVWSDVPIDAKCDEIVIETKSFYGQGSGVAEVELK
jgi:hypothetical protein